MKAALVAFVLLSLSAVLIGAAAASDPTPVGGPSGKVLTYSTSISDEFNGASLDLSKWDNPLPYLLNGGNWPAAFEPANSQLSGGYLQQTLALGGLPSPPPVDPVNGPYTCSQGYIMETAATTYGYYEARIKCANVQVDNAFWLWNPTIPKYTEIDAVEQIGSAKPTTAFFNAIYSFDHVNYTSNPNNWVSTSSFTASYHVFGLYWSPSTIAWYVDGVRRAQIANAEFYDPLRITLDLTATPNWAGPVDTGLLPKTMSTDYVRYWSEAIVPGDANLDGRVDVTDLAILAANYRKQVTGGWSMADFNGDGVVDVLDLAVLAAHYRQTSGGPTLEQAEAMFSLPQTVPEPSTVVMLVGLVGLAVYGLRRRMK